VYLNEDYVLDVAASLGLLSAEQVMGAKEKVASGQPAISELVANGQLDEQALAQGVAQQYGYSAVSLSQFHIEPQVYSTIPADIAKRYQVVPIQDDGRALTVVLADPTNFEATDTLPNVTGREIQIYVGYPTEIRDFIESQYAGAPAAAPMGFQAPQEDGVNVDLGVGSDVAQEDAPIIALVQDILTEAFQLKVSDIHIEPLETMIRVRYRLDGKLMEMAQHPKKLLPAIVTRLKVMSGTMDIAEKRMPQDGRIQITVNGKAVDLRVSSVPSNHGESIVMRILDKSALTLGLGQVGMYSDDQELIQEMLGYPDGVVLVTGPTGSGKTTTLYSCLNEINTPDRKIITVEDPVEYELSGINQVMVREDVGMTFAAALRAMLRQAPNIIMVGEIRDEETATIAINASLTGHLVFSTLHTNDATSSIARLGDIGVKRFLMASALRGVLAQRLVRKLCDQCKVPTSLTEKEASALGLDPSTQIYGPGSCTICRNTGYKGRMGIFEIFKVDDEVRHLINKNLSNSDMRKQARQLGMRTLREDGIRKVLAGETSAAEVLSVTMND